MTTKAAIHELCEQINKAREYYGLSANYYVEYAYGKPRLEKSNEPNQMGGSQYISPRLPAPQLADWMQAYLAGMNAGYADKVGY